MSRILVVEPQKMLQHAFSVALFPDHQVEIGETIPGSEAVKDVDVVIVDAVALRERNALTDRELHAAQSWKTPTIWIDVESESRSPTREKLVVVNPPADKDSLQRALAECLGTPDVGKRAGSGTSGAASPVSRAAHAKERDAIAATDANEKVIELVDVVEEGAASKSSKAPQHRTR